MRCNPDTLKLKLSYLTYERCDRLLKKIVFGLRLKCDSSFVCSQYELHCLFDYSLLAAKNMQPLLQQATRT